MKIVLWAILTVLSIFFAWLWVLMWGFGLGGLYGGKELSPTIKVFCVFIVIGGLILFIYLLPRLLFKKIFKTNVYRIEQEQSIHKQRNIAKAIVVFFIVLCICYLIFGFIFLSEKLLYPIYRSNFIVRILVELFSFLIAFLAAQRFYRKRQRKSSL